MRTALPITLVVVVGLATVIVAASLDPPRGDSGRARVPVLAELFTSEGCSSCPSADDLLRRLIEEQPIDGVEIIGMSEHVDYWDGLGWKDRFSSPRFTDRQNAYAQAFHSDQIYTPQLVINGRAALVGSDRPAAQRALIASAKAPRATVNVSAVQSVDGSALSVRLAVRDRPAAANRASVAMAVVEDDLVTDVAGGENAHRRLRHSAVARTLETIGALGAGATSAEFTRQVRLNPEWRRDRLRIVAFVQDDRTHAVSGVAAAGVEPLSR